MTNQELQSYQKTGPSADKSRKRVRDFGVYEIVECVFCFLFGKIFLFGRLSPLGIAYFAAAFPRQKRLMTAASVCLGFLSAGMGLRVFQYGGALIITSAFTLLMDKEFSQRPWLYGLVAALSTFVTGFVFVAFEGFLVYDVLFLVLEALLSFFAYFAFKRAGNVMRSLKNRRIFEPIETLSLLLLAAGTVVSFGCIPALVGVAHIISLSVIFTAAVSCGFPLTCTAGVLFGVVNSLTAPLPSQTVAIYAISALAAGLMQKKGRWGVLLGGLLAGTLATVYFPGGIDNGPALYHALTAGVVLFLIPDGWLSVFGELLQSPVYAEDSVERLRDIVSHRLAAASASFEALSEVFNQAVERRINTQMRDPSLLFEKTADCVCKSCTLMKYCWQKEYGETEQALRTLYGRMERKGAPLRDDVPERFRNKCIRLEAFLESLGRHYEVHKVNLLWAGRVLESRNLVAEQFKNVSSVLKHLQSELLLEPSEGIYLERKLMAALDRNGICVDAVRVTGAEALEVLLTLSEEEEVCDARQITTIVSNALQTTMLKMPPAWDDGPRRMHFMEQARYTMEAGVAQAAGTDGEVCGDQHLFSVSADGKFVLALSDGMGQGKEAETQSKMTVHLLRKLLSAGFDKETALKLLNSMLMASSEPECFATADLCLVNLYSGALEFIKIGASQSFLKSGKSVEAVSCTSLPAGIVCNVEADRDLKYAKEGDFVVLVTDGVTDALSGGEAGQLAELIGRFAGQSPQLLADEILRAALVQAGDKPKDDMTVIAARLTAA